MHNKFVYLGDSKNDKYLMHKPEVFGGNTQWKPPALSNSSTIETNIRTSNGVRQSKISLVAFLSITWDGVFDVIKRFELLKFL